MLIFEKSKVWKIFVEMQTLEGASLVIKHLNGKELFEDGSKMNIFYSKMKRLTFQNSNSGGYGILIVLCRYIKSKEINFEH